MCIRNSDFKHTAWSTSLSPRDADDVGLGVFDFTRPVSHKNWQSHFRDRWWRRLRYLPPKLRGDMATDIGVALDSSFKLLLMSRILVAVEKSLTPTIHTIMFDPWSNYTHDNWWSANYLRSFYIMEELLHGPLTRYAPLLVAHGASIAWKVFPPPTSEETSS